MSPEVVDVFDSFSEHRLGLQELAKQFGTKIDLNDPKNSKGLTAKRAALILTRDGSNLFDTPGPNQLTARKGRPLWVRFFAQFISLFPLLLEVAGILCFVAWALEGGTDAASDDNLYLGIVLLVVVLATAIFSFLQEVKASRAVAGFASMAPPSATVVRGGKVMKIEASQVVVGDIVRLKAGDKIPGDVVILVSEEMKVDNSSITGEAEPQKRLAAPTTYSWRPRTWGFSQPMCKKAKVKQTLI